MDEYIKKTTKKLSSKTMEGNRALFLSKLLGFINEENKFTNQGKKLILNYKIEIKKKLKIYYLNNEKFVLE